MLFFFNVVFIILSWRGRSALQDYLNLLFPPSVEEEEQDGGAWLQFLPDHI